MVIRFKTKAPDGTTIFTCFGPDGNHERGFKTYQEFDTFIRVNQISKIILF